MRLFAPLLFALLPASAFAAEVSEMDMLTGCWELVKGSLKIQECWMPPSAGITFGASRTTRDGKLTGFEQLLVRKVDDKVMYQVRLQGKPETTEFTLVKSTQDTLVFENLQHDFPQRIVYQRKGDTLTARIMNAAGTKGREIPMVRSDGK